MKKIKFTAILIAISLLFHTVGVYLSKESKAAVNELSMEEYYKQVMVEGKNGIDVAGKVTISGWKDYLMFRDCMTKKEATAYVKFVQESDIKTENLTFSYNEKYDKIAIYKDGAEIGAIGRNKKIYNNISENKQISISSIGLETAYIYHNNGENRFYGTYDGGGHSIEGVIFDNVSQADSGLFGCIYDYGSVKNVNVKNCCMMYSYGVISGYNYGNIENVNVEDTIGFGTAFAGIAGLNDGMVKNCSVSGCEFMSGSLAGDKNGGIGGIVSQMILGTAASCEVSDTILRGFEDAEAVIGGIVAKQESNTPLYGGISCIACVSDATLIGGYSMGGICGIMEDDWEISHINAAYLKNCIFKGKIYQKNQDISYTGGIIGKVRSDSEIYVVECTNQGDIYRLGKTSQYNGAIGGILGESTGDAVLFACTNKGKIFDNEPDDEKSGFTYIGGLAGEANRYLRLLNCSNEADISMGMSHSGDRIGGLVGKISDSTMQYVANSRNCGSLTGYYTTGLAAVVEKNGSKNDGMKIENCVNFGRLQGVKNGGLVGDITSGGLLRCYTSYAGQLVINKNESEITESSSVTESEIQSLAEVLSQGSQNMTTMATYGYIEKYDYAIWKVGENSLPEPRFETEYSYPALTTLNTGADTSAFRVDDTENMTPKPTQSLQTPTLMPTQAVETPTIVPTQNPTTEPTKSSTVSDNEDVLVKPVRQFKAEEKLSNKVVLKWKKNKSAKGYVLYRSAKQKSGYKKIAELKSDKVSYTDKKVNKGKTYYYHIKAYYKMQNKNVYSEEAMLKVLIPHLTEPVITLSKGKLDNGTRYMQIYLKKAEGEYVQVYIRQNGKAFIKMKLDDEKISHYKNKIRFSYKKGKSTYICKVRTYRYVKGKKQYSGFSKIKKIRL